MIKTHVGVFILHLQRPGGSKAMPPRQDKRLLHKFFWAGSCRKMGDNHIDPMTGILYSHDMGNCRK